MYGEYLFLEKTIGDLLAADVFVTRFLSSFFVEDATQRVTRLINML